MGFRHCLDATKIAEKYQERLHNMDLSINTNTLLAAFTIIGFSIQQLIQILDFFLTDKIHSSYTKKNRTISESDYKKSIITLMTFIIGFVITATSKISIFQLINDTTTYKNGIVDILLTSLFISGGAEGVNIIVKFTNYFKEAKKEEVAKNSVGEITVTPTEVTIAPSKTYQFISKISNTEDQNVTWAVVQSEGGTINNTGLFTALAVEGTYQILVTSKKDITRSAVAKVTVKKNS